MTKYTDIGISVACSGCDEEVVRITRVFHEEGELPVIALEFQGQTNYRCPHCGVTTAIGDIDAVNVEDL